MTMEDNKNILNMKLEDEPFLNKKPNFGQNLIGLHNRGIYTLRDFINMDVRAVREETQQGFFSHAAQRQIALLLPVLFEQAEER